MTHVCEFPTAVRLREVGTLAQILDFHNPDNGVDVAGRIRRPLPNQRQGRLKSARVRGSFAVGPRLDDDGVLSFPVLVFGTSWAQAEQRFITLLDAIHARDEFYIETELSGVTTRWFCDAPVDFDDAVHDRRNNRQTYELRFLVQPNPTVVIA